MATKEIQQIQKLLTHFACSIVRKQQNTYHTIFYNCHCMSSGLHTLAGLLTQRPRVWITIARANNTISIINIKNNEGYRCRKSGTLHYRSTVGSKLIHLSLFHICVYVYVYVCHSRRTMPYRTAPRTALNQIVPNRTELCCAARLVLCSKFAKSTVRVRYGTLTFL